MEPPLIPFHHTLLQCFVAPGIVSGSIVSGALNTQRRNNGSNQAKWRLSASRRREQSSQGRAGHVGCVTCPWTRPMKNAAPLCKSWVWSPSGLHQRPSMARSVTHPEFVLTHTEITQNTPDKPRIYWPLGQLRTLPIQTKQRILVRTALGSRRKRGVRKSFVDADVDEDFSHPNSRRITHC